MIFGSLLVPFAKAPLFPMPPGFLFSPPLQRGRAALVRGLPHGSGPPFPLLLLLIFLDLLLGAPSPGCDSCVHSSRARSRPSNPKETKKYPEKFYFIFLKETTQSAFFVARFPFFLWRLAVVWHACVHKKGARGKKRDTKQPEKYATTRHTHNAKHASGFFSLPAHERQQKNVRHKQKRDNKKKRGPSFEVWAKWLRPFFSLGARALFLPLMGAVVFFF